MPIPRNRPIVMEQLPDGQTSSDLEAWTEEFGEDSLELFASEEDLVYEIVAE